MLTCCDWNRHKEKVNKVPGDQAYSQGPILFECDCVFLHAILWNCSHGATAICIDTYIIITHHNRIEWVWNLFHVWCHTHKCDCDIAAAPYEQYHWHPHNSLKKRSRIQRESHRVNEPSGCRQLYCANSVLFLLTWKKFVLFNPYLKIEITDPWICFNLVILTSLCFLYWNMSV